jgi:SAM-dependent methyltransferase
LVTAPIVRAGVLVLLAGLVSLADAKTRADCERDYRPQRGQEGKDVVWVPTEDAMVVRMLEMANVTPADIVYDLGAGDGKISIAAAKRFGATSVGVEYDRALVRHARCLARAEGVHDRVSFVRGDIFETDFSDATVVTLYLLPDLNLRLRPTLLAMKPGTRVVSYSFTMFDWQPDDYVDTDEGSAYFWIVPADVHGAWTFRSASGAEAFAVQLEQTYQNLQGTAHGERITGKLTGDTVDFEFTAGGQRVRVTGTVASGRITGTVTRAGLSTEHVGTRD